MNRKEELEQRFFNVQMPDWFKKVALLVRLFCAAIIVVVLCLHFTRGVQDVTRGVPDVTRGVQDVLISVGVVISLAFLMALPSVPKAFIEQRNRIRGLKDGTMEEWQRLQEDSQP